MLLVPAAELIPLSPISFGLVGEAHALVGHPATPVSVAGVARRSAVRTTAVVATSAAASASAASAQSAAASQAAAAKAATAAPPPAPAPAPSAGAPALGTVVGKLPAGCVSAPVSGVEYYLCGGVYYRAAFQGNNLVYVVQKP
jgi:hypothetical protein